MTVQGGSIIGLAQVMDGATAFNEGNVSETYRGIVRTHDGSERGAILKDLPAKELANEVLAAAIGIFIGMPIPPPFIAFASDDRLATKNGPRVEDGALLFASVDVNQPPVSMLYRGSLGPAVLDRLAKWPNTGQLYGFDALVANIDRHSGNLLFNGDREVWLIDHGYCFTGPAWAPSDLQVPEAPVRNRLRDWLTPVLDDATKSAAAGGAAKVPQLLSSVDFSKLAQANYVADLLENGDFNAVVKYLSGRFKHAGTLAAVALEMLEV